MPRSNRRRRDEHRPLRMGLAPQTTQTWMGRSWVVRQLTGATSERTYRCPGCVQEITPGTAHVVVWPADGLGAVDDRRHWHNACWKARDAGRFGR